jgi:hypothetical protein
MLPTTLVEDSPNDRHQTIAPSIHMSMLILAQKVGPHVDPVNSSMDSLQKLRRSATVKNNIISTISYCPE